MEKHNKPQCTEHSPSTYRVVLLTVAGVLAAVFLLQLLFEGELYMAAWFLIWGVAALVALCALSRRRSSFFRWPLAGKLLASLTGLCGALGMLILSVNLGVMATYIANAVWWSVPLGILSFVLVFFLLAVVVLIWVPRRD